MQCSDMVTRRHFLSPLRRALAALAAVVSFAACSSGSDGPTSATGQIGFGATGAIISSNRRGGLLQAELLLDGARVDSRTYQPAETGLVILEVSDMFIAPGAHRLSLKVVRQTTNPTTWDVQLSAAILNFRTNSSQQFSLPNDVATVTLSDGQSTTLDFTVKP